MPFIGIITLLLLFLDNPQEMSFDSEVGDCADYYFIYGGNADGVIAGVRELTGQAPLYPALDTGILAMPRTL